MNILSPVWSGPSSRLSVRGWRLAVAQVHAKHRARRRSDLNHGQNSLQPMMPGAVHEVAGQDGAAHAQPPTVGRLPAPAVGHELSRPGIAFDPLVAVEYMAGAEGVPRLHGKIHAVDGDILRVPEFVLVKLTGLKLSEEWGRAQKESNQEMAHDVRRAGVLRCYVALALRKCTEGAHERAFLSP